MTNNSLLKEGLQFFFYYTLPTPGIFFTLIRKCVYLTKMNSDYGRPSNSIVLKIGKFLRDEFSGLVLAST